MTKLTAIAASLAFVTIVGGCSQTGREEPSLPGGFQTALDGGVPVFSGGEEGLPEATRSGTLEIERRDGVWCLWLSGDESPRSSPVRLLEDLTDLANDRLFFDGHELTNGQRLVLAGGTFDGDSYPCDGATAVFFAGALLESDSVETGLGD